MEASVFEYSVPRLQKRITFVSEVLIRVIFSDLTARLLVGNIVFYTFQYASEVHSYNTRYATQQNLYKPRVRTNTGKQMISLEAD